MQYPKSYHLAVNHLIAFGGHGGDPTKGRRLIARALRDLQDVLGHERARSERRHMLFISGQFPVKTPPSINIYATGIVCLSVCTPAYTTRREIERRVNLANPSGIPSPWTISKDAAFADGTPMPHQCEDDPLRQHWLLNC